MMLKKLFPIFVVLACVYTAWSAARNGVHDFAEDRCGDCHAFAPIKGDSQARVLIAPVSELCIRCHDKPKNSLSHPVELMPVNVMIPSDLPLSWDGKVTCSTCHDIHAASSEAGEAHEHYLRRASGREFCEACHRGGLPETGKPARHSQLLAEAHLKFEGERSGRVDKISEICLSCHIGVIGDKTPLSNGDYRHGAGPDEAALNRSHPIGVNYRKASKRSGMLLPKEMVDRRIRLVKGKVSCASCHDIYSREHRLLTISDESSALCLGCHISN